MKALIIHHRWGYGGSVTVFYYTIKALTEAGFDVTISTVDPPDLKSYRDIVGESLPGNVRFQKALNVNIGFLTIYKPLLSLRQVLRGSYDIIIETHGYLSYLEGKPETPIVYYMHFPPILRVDKFWNLEVSKYELKGPTSYGFKHFISSIPWWLYFQPYRFLAKLLYEDLVRRVSRILVNSSYTLKALKYSLAKYTGLDREGILDILSKTSILYPPLPRAGELVKLRGPSKLPCVATIGRFSLEKRYDLVIEVAKLLPDAQFIVAGGVYGRTSRSYYEWVKRRAPTNMIVAANIPADLKNLILSKCSVYLHTMIGEHFGIAPLEALAAGMTPVIPMYSGTWTDICSNGEYCYGYKRGDPKSIAEAVREALEKPKSTPLDHIEKFKPETFIKGIVKIVEEALRC